MANIKHSAEYKRVIASQRWRKLRLQFIHTFDSVCQRCKQRSDDLSLHHRNYDRLGHELPSDLELLCRECHAVADLEREKISDSKRAATQYDNGLRTFVIKRHGEEFAGCESPEEIDAFENWLQKKQESRDLYGTHER